MSKDIMITVGEGYKAGRIMKADLFDARDVELAKVGCQRKKGGDKRKGDDKPEKVAGKTKGDGKQKGSKGEGRGANRSDGITWIQGS